MQELEVRFHAIRDGHLVPLQLRIAEIEIYDETDMVIENGGERGRWIEEEWKRRE